MPKGFVYILECADGTYYTGSTIDIDKRLVEHTEGKGANHTKKRLPVKLVYFEEHQRIDDAFAREKQIQKWTRVKKEALIENNWEKLIEYSKAYRDVASRASATRHSKKNKNTLVPEVLEGTKEKNIMSYISNGKLLLTGEYVILNGALALALPTKYGQSLTIEENNSGLLHWKSYNENNQIWFEDTFELISNTDFKSLKAKNEISDRLLQIFDAAKRLNPEFLNHCKGLNITTHQDFNRHWGLGTSSTLINNISNWANINAYTLLDLTFGGSGYDIACAQNNTPITYQLKDKTPSITPVDFSPSFKDCIYFVYLEKKQNSRDGIATYKSYNGDLTSFITEINSITENILSCKRLENFNVLLEKHESIISKVIGLEPVKLSFFPDFNGTIKSLGAWGGDFVMVTSVKNPRAYFYAKGYHTVIPYTEMIKAL